MTFVVLIVVVITIDDTSTIHQCQFAFDSHARTDMNGKVFVVCHEGLKACRHENYLIWF